MLEELQEKITPTQETPQEKTEEKTEVEESKTVTYTQEHMSKMQSSFEKKQKDAEKRATDAENAVGQTTGRLTELEDKLRQAERERDDRLFAGLEDEPGAERIKALYSKIKTEEDVLRQKNTEFSKIQNQALEGLKFRDAMVVAKGLKDSYGVSIDADEFMGCKTFQEMEGKAKDLVIENLRETKPREPAVPAHVDSGLQTTSGGGRIWKESDIQNLSNEELKKYAHDISKAVDEGRIRKE